ncbi:hypothetical protein [Mesorhizobium intechi]|nr:hypothetical protein [Mesorhizobium intechi]
MGFFDGWGTVADQLEFAWRPGDRPGSHAHFSNMQQESKDRKA